MDRQDFDELQFLAEQVTMKEGQFARGGAAHTDTWVEIGGVERPVRVSYDYTPPSRGSRDRFGAALEPDEGADFHITSIIDRESKHEYGLEDIDPDGLIEIQADLKNQLGIEEASAPVPNYDLRA